MSYLVADIGGTHARFRLIPVGGSSAMPASGAPLRLRTADFQDGLGLIEAAIGELGATSIRAGCLAIAGPVADGLVQITNGGLTFAESELSAALGWPVRLVNDFFALSSAVPMLRRIEPVGGDPALGQQRDVKAVIGPGTGLGMGILIPEGREAWRVLGSEGGQADLAPGNPLEQEVLTLLQAAHGAVCWETVLSGPGLVHLYQVIAALWGATPRNLSAEEISRQGVGADDPICHQTLETFFGLLGSAAGNLALTVCARAGVYIGGGIVPALREFALTSPLRRRFEERSGLPEFVADIPLFLILDDNPGLTGAAVCLPAAR
jgi:glucokinase